MATSSRQSRAVPPTLVGTVACFERIGLPTCARTSARGALSVVKRDRYITVGIHPALHPASRAILFICDAQQHHDQQPTQAPKNNG